MKLSDLDLSTLEWQEGKKGKFRMTELRSGEEEQWINGTFKKDWYYTFKYESGEKFILHFDTTNKLIQ